jgi:tetratricopeptide (TPR) repeat protein
MEFTEVLAALGQFDSAWHYYSLYKPARNKTVYLRVYWVSTGECYLLQGENRQALQKFSAWMTEHRKLNDRNEVMRTLLAYGKTYLALNNNVEALRMAAKDGTCPSNKSSSISATLPDLSTVYDRLHQADSANHYFRQYIAMKTRC